jgi:hypothetical protein
VATSVLVIELREQLLARERELHSKEGIITVWEDGLVAFEGSLGSVCTERDARRVQAKAAQ